MAEPRVARAGRRWRIGRGNAAGGHKVHAVHADAREGRHVADEGPGRWRAHGYSGPSLGIGGGNANALPHPTF